MLWEMAQWVKSLATSPDPKAHMVQEQLMLEAVSVSGDACGHHLTWGPQELADSITELIVLGVRWEVLNTQ